MKKTIFLSLFIFFTSIIYPQSNHYRNDTDDFEATLNCSLILNIQQDSNYYSCNSDYDRARFSVVVTKLPINHNLDQRSIKIFLNQYKTELENRGIYSYFSTFKTLQSLEYWVENKYIGSWTKSLIVIHGVKTYTLNCTTDSKTNTAILIKNFENNFNFL